MNYMFIKIRVHQKEAKARAKGTRRWKGEGGQVEGNEEFAKKKKKKNHVSTNQTASENY